MIKEISIASNFITKLLSSSEITLQQKVSFNSFLKELLNDKYSKHWDPFYPLKGNAYRSVQVTAGYIDPILLTAASKSGIKRLDRKCFPSEIIIWIDPNEVNYRFGESGSIAHLNLDQDLTFDFTSSYSSPSIHIVQSATYRSSISHANEEDSQSDTSLPSSSPSNDDSTFSLLKKSASLTITTDLSSVVVH